MCALMLHFNRQRSKQVAGDCTHSNTLLYLNRFSLRYDAYNFMIKPEYFDNKMLSEILYN